MPIHLHSPPFESICSALTCTSEEWGEIYQNDKLSTEVLRLGVQDMLSKNREKLKAANDKYRLDKLLDAMFQYAPSDSGKRYVAVALRIAHKKGEDIVVNVAQAWMDHLFLPMLTISIKDSKIERSGSQTPTFNDPTETIEEPTSRSEQRALRNALRIREKYCCAVTGAFDCYRAIYLREQGRDDEISMSAFAEWNMDAAHIIPFSSHDFDENGRTPDIRDTAQTWDMLQAWTGLDVSQLVGPKINSPANAIYLTTCEHAAFGQFRFYFDKGAFPDVLNKYKVQMSRPQFRLSNRRDSADVQFRAVEDPDHIEPPNPEFLEVHAAFAKVLHISGAAEFVDKLQADGEPLFMHPTNDFAMIISHRLAILADQMDRVFRPACITEKVEDDRSSLALASIVLKR